MALGFGAIRTAVMALRMDTTGYVRDMFTAQGANARFDAALERSGGRLGVMSAQLAVVGATGSIVIGKLAADFGRFQKEITLAAIANDEGIASFSKLSDLALKLGRDLETDPTRMAELVKVVQNFGLKTDEGIESVSRYSASLAMLAETAAPETAEIMFRLLNITRDANETMDQAALRADGLAASIFRVGTQTTAGVQDLLKFIQQFQAVGVAADLSAEEIVGLSGVIADLNPTIRETARSLFIRLFETEETAGLARILGMDEASVKKFREENPVEFVRRSLQALQREQAKGGLTTAMGELGLGGLREAPPLLTAIGNLERFDEIMATATNTERNKLEMDLAMQAVLDTLSAKWEGFLGSLKAARIEMGAALAPAIIAVLDALTKLVNFLVEHKGILALAGLVVGGLAAKATFNSAAMLGRVVGGMVGGGEGALAMGFLGKAGPQTGLFARMGAGVGRFARGFFPGAVPGQGMFSAAGSEIATTARSLFSGLLPGFERNAAGRIVSSTTGRFAAASAAELGAGGAVRLLGGSLLRLAGPIGIIISLVGPLTSLFGGLGDMLLTLGKDQGGILGFVINLLGAFAKALEFIGAIISWIIDHTIGILQKAWNWLMNDFLGGALGKFFDAASDVVHEAGETIDGWTDSIKGTNDASKEATELERLKREEAERAARGAAGSGGTMNIYVNGQTFASDEFVNLIRAAFPNVGVSVRG